MTSSVLAPFRVRSFRFQWPADLATSWAAEMEALILGWYVLIATGSVQYLVVFGALIWVGALFSPLVGIASDRFGVRGVLFVTRGLYALLAAVLTVLTMTDALRPWHVFVISGLAGLARPSDQAMRNVLVSQTISPHLLLSALAISRTTYDSSKVAGALAGAGGMALIGMGPAYIVVTALYIVAFCLTLGVAGPPPRAAQGAAASTGALASLVDAARYVWRRHDVLAAFAIAFLVNLLAYPFVLGLLPYVARDVYGTDQAGLGYLAAAFAVGALTGTLVLLGSRSRFAAARVMLTGASAWFACVFLLAFTSTLWMGVVLLFLAGLMQSFCMTPLAAVMLRSSTDDMRGRVMGMRMLAVWGLPLGLLAAGPIIAGAGFTACVLLYSSLGLAAMLAIGWRWRGALWARSAEANRAG